MSYLTLSMALYPSTHVSFNYYILLSPTWLNQLTRNYKLMLEYWTLPRLLTVSHTKLLHKLEYNAMVIRSRLPVIAGITDNILYWIKSFLHRHTQQVAIEDSYSLPCFVTSGVPQGSVLAFLNDISYSIRSQLRLFADTCLIYRTIHSRDDHYILQDDIN